MTPAAFRAEQRGVAIRMAAALGIALVALTLASTLSSQAEPASAEQRASSAALAVLIAALWLAVAIGNVARRRFLSIDDIAGSGSHRSGDAIRHSAAILQNTLEQTALAIPVYLALAVLLDRPSTVLMTLAGLFSLGRLLFWRGYARGASARAFGFALTFYPTVCGLALALFVATIGAR